MKPEKYPFLIFTPFLLVSCLTTGGSQYYESFSMDKEDAVEIDSAVEVPGVDLFVSAPYINETEQVEDPVESTLIIPETEIPLVEVESQPVEQDGSESRQNNPDRSLFYGVAPEPAVERKPVQVIEPTQEITAPVQVVKENEPSAESENVTIVPPPSQSGAAALPAQVDKSESSETSDPALSYSEQLEVKPGEELIISIDREGWIFDSSLSSGEVEFRNREFADGKTRFLFFPRESGDFILVFLLQNSETGNEEKMTYNLQASVEDSSAGIPIIIDPSSTELTVAEDNEPDSSVVEALEEENVPGVVASIDQLTDSETDPGSDMLIDAFDLLEKQGGYDDYLVNLAEHSFRLYPYDHNSAEMLYRAAQALENPGINQDIEKAVALFKMVRDYFPLSAFSDRAEERIRYLERHFMKIY